MKWKAVCAVLAVVMLASAALAPVALAQEPQPGAQPRNAPQAEENAPERRFMDILRRANQMRGTVRGKVTAVGADEIEVSVGTDETAEAVIFAVNDETIYRVPEIQEPTLADVEVDMLVAVRPSAEEEDLAKMVAVVSPRQMRTINTGLRMIQSIQKLLGHNARRGEVVAIGSESVTLSTPQGEVELILGEETRFVGADGEEIGLDDLSVGDKITVVGRPDPAAPINAGVIKIMPEKPEE